MASQITVGIPFQVRALRKQRKWDQAKLANEANMAQPRISAIERPGYGNLNLATLLRLASAFSVGLMVRFVPFSELLQWENSFSPDDFSVPSIDAESDSAFSSVLATTGASFKTMETTAHRFQLVGDTSKLHEDSVTPATPNAYRVQNRTLAIYAQVGI